MISAVAVLDLLQRLFGLVEQAHVLDRDHRLVGEGLDQADLPLGVGPDFAAPDVMTPMSVVSLSIGTQRTRPHVFAFVEVAGLVNADPRARSAT